MTVFSIVIPNYNQSCFIETALKSLQHQHYPFFLAVMDGGSTDGFQNVISPYRRIITHWRSFPDNGQAAAIQEGFEAVSGDILGWLNADDYYFPNIFPQIAEIFQRHPEIDVVYGNAVHVTPEGQFCSYFPAIQSYNTYDLTRNCFMCQPACFFRRSACEQVGGIDPSLTYTMDWDLWCRLSAAGAGFLRIPQVIAAVRCYPQTKTVSGGWTRYREIIRIERRYGRRVIPYSWIGFLYYHLSNKNSKNYGEQLAYLFLKTIGTVQALRFRRRAAAVHSSGTIFGFDPWNQSIREACEIYLPWYYEQPIRFIDLRLEPRSLLLSVEINGSPASQHYIENGRLWINLPVPVTNLLRLKLCASQVPCWKIVNIVCG